MTNHIHLLVTPEYEYGLSKTIQMLGRSYVQYFNHTYKRTGTLWEGRYKATLVDSESYALICYRYLELNPVRANMINHPSEYQWSSYRYNGAGIANELITPHELYMRLGNSVSARCQSYRKLFNTLIDEMTIEQIREATNKSWALGNDYFKQIIAQKMNRQIEPIQRGGDRRSIVFKKMRE